MTWPYARTRAHRLAPPLGTEILFDLGLGDQVVGVTFECDFPAEARTKRIVSTSGLPEGLSPGEIDAVVKERMATGEDLYHLDRDAFADLDPELVVTQDLCAVCAIDVDDVDEALGFLACSAEVLTLDPMSLEEVLATIVATGETTGTTDRAAEIVDALRVRLAAVAEQLADVPTRSALVLEWTDPAFTAGHWVPDLVEAAGGRPVLSFPGRHSEGVEWDAVRSADAEVVVVAPCGFRLDGASDLAAEVIATDRVPPSAEVWAVDADAIVVRPGPRVVEGVEVFASILHPDRCGPPPDTLARRIR